MPTTSVIGSGTRERSRIVRIPASIGLVILVLVLASCGATPTDSGINGLVTIGPISPVEQVGVPNDAPYQATIVVNTADGDAVTTVKSGADGLFTVNLAPGAYVLEPQSSGLLPFAQPQEVTVQPHLYAEVTVSYDSGIR
jgi:hypothetical protein